MADQQEPKMVDVHLSRIVISDGQDRQHIFLHEFNGPRGFPIVIGNNEAAEIERVVKGLEFERPMTHQLIHSVIESLAAELKRCDIVDLRKNTFYAQLVLQRGDTTAVVDARPSDAIALALRARCGIRVAESVLEQVRTDKGPDALPDPESDPTEED